MAETATSGRRSRQTTEYLNLVAMRKENQKTENDGGGGFILETLEEKLKAKE